MRILPSSLVRLRTEHQIQHGDFCIGRTDEDKKSIGFRELGAELGKRSRDLLKS